MNWGSRRLVVFERIFTIIKEFANLRKNYWMWLKLTCVCSSSMLDALVEKSLGERDPMALGPETNKVFCQYDYGEIEI